jgi:hypothetical protein
MIIETKTHLSEKLLRYFKATEGGYSIVTETEYGDSQITLSGAEAKLVSTFARKWLQNRRGSVSSLEAKGIDAGFTFKLHPTGEPVKLNLIYPKPTKNELRLYLKAGKFKPRPGIYWTVFLRDGDLWLGSFDELLGSTVQALPYDFDGTGREEFLEPEVDNFQIMLNEAPKKMVKSESMLWGRNPSVARAAIIENKYTCELFPKNPTFLSKASGHPFMEAHHLIPMKMQHKFEYKLDIAANICVLSPYAHRLLHHGVTDEVGKHVSALIEKRLELLSALELHHDDVLSLYS